MTFSRVIDYETIEETFFVVTATDSGNPQLTSTATVLVTVENLNDNYPSLDKVSKQPLKVSLRSCSKSEEMLLGFL